MLRRLRVRDLTVNSDIDRLSLDMVTGSKLLPQSKLPLVRELLYFLQSRLGTFPQRY